ncbi:MAG: endonuclease Q family protein, partial [Nanoarchaeota archaeon]
GSKSGFNSLKEAFGSQYEKIYAIETGMSSDPEMNWKIKELEEKAILSFSDSHSFWPWRIGREATIFSLKEGEKLNYNLIINQIRNKTYKSTVETDPGYGIYHWDGHRDCKFSCPPSKTKELNGICPVCNKKLTIGVENRVEELKNNTGIPKNAKAFYKLLPLHELIAFYLKTSMNSKKVWAIYDALIVKYENEFNILLKVDRNILSAELAKQNMQKLADLIIDNRIANLKVKPGYDGVYGELVEK